MSETSYKLISFSICPFVQRPRIVMLEKHIAHSIEYIDLQAPPVWFHEISPLEKVPVLIVDDLALFESMPICEYLDEVSPGSLYPDDPLTRARQRAWIEFGNDVLSQLHSMVTAAEETDLKRALALLEERWDSVEEVLTTGPYFAGTEFGMVDAVFAPIFRIVRELQNFTGLEIIADDAPKVKAWASRLLERPSVIDAVPASYSADYLAFVRRVGGVLCQRISN